MMTRMKMSANSGPVGHEIFILGLVMISLVSTALAQSVTVSQKSASIPPAAVRPQPGSVLPPHHVAPMSSRAKEHYQLIWGIDSLDVKAVESGQMIRFSYYVLDATKAAQLNDKKNNPFLVDEQARVKLEIPTMEKVGQLRQSSPPEAGKSYWMVFSNKGSIVKPGDRVSVVIGKFKADGLYVR